MAREEERDPERREAAARASGEEEEEEGEEGLSDSDDEDEDDEPGSGREEEEEAAAARRERSEDARLQRAGVPPAAVPAAAARDRSGRRQPRPPPGPLPCRPRMPSPDDEDRERRRSRRRDLLLSQLCFLALVALLLWSLSSMQEHNGECSRLAPSGRCGSGSSGLPGRARGEQAGRQEGVPGTRTPPASRRGSGGGGPGGQDRAVESRPARGGAWLALGTLTCASWLSVLLTHRQEGLVAEGVGAVPLKKSPKASNEVVPVRFGTCAGNHLYTFGLLRA